MPHGTDSGSGCAARGDLRPRQFICKNESTSSGAGPQLAYTALSQHHTVRNIAKKHQIGRDKILSLSILPDHISYVYCLNPKLKCNILHWLFLAWESKENIITQRKYYILTHIHKSSFTKLSGLSPVLGSVIRNFQFLPDCIFYPRLGQLLGGKRGDSWRREKLETNVRNY